MTPILGVNDNIALKHADALGRAMQLTNISRDIIEDFKMQRIYLPQKWLQQYSILQQDFLNSATQTKLFEVVLKVLDRADQFYLEGRKGLKYLPFRAGLSICIASFLYQGIGNKIRKIGLVSFKERTVLTGFEKLNCIVKALFFYLKLGLNYE
jgi:phytoene synthase